ncbi:MAG: type I-U CRISPR-associated protein Cas5/Cas6 [Acidobacteria bacterium]|nr:type I-U CRISPR-associated protein Cas5/Cas6 [Acidobacteriota bacterium]MYH22220.1 type I-U CRISPR-associated protein Cas5/Cas6 [Acidobacteriota bacterium]
MSLLLEIEFLTGAYRGTSEPASEEADWPPQPDRVFSALVAAWGSRGELAAEREALEWLERQDPPAIHAAPASPRTAPTVFVPPNDARSSRKTETYLRVLPDRRGRQPRRFPAARPEPGRHTSANGPSASLVFAWSVDPDQRFLPTLESLARDVPYVGHSTSLTRCRFLYGDAKNLPFDALPPKRRVYPGRLAELVRAYHANPVRPLIRVGASVPVHETASPERTDSHWLVLEAVTDRPLDLRGAAPICRLLRDTLMSGYGRNGDGESIPELVSGHTPDRRPTKEPHLSIVPMAYVGSEHATGRIYGFALVPPGGTHLGDIRGLAAAFRRVSRYEAARERRVLTLQGGPLDWPLELAPTGDEFRPLSSLRPTPYCTSARVWATVTPIVLDRHLKTKTEAEIRGLVARCCANSGLPAPNPDRIRTGRHATLRGIPPARPHRGAPPWSRWQVPKSLASRPLVHAVIEFDEEVAGPVLLGAGRFTGLGLCRGLRS